MINITKTKQAKEYQMPEMPNFENKRAKVVWLKTQQMLGAIHNIKSVSVQVKDIKHMIYSKNPRLISLYARLRFIDNCSSYNNNNDYITITKSSNLNKSLMYALISSDWLLDIEDLKNKSIKELQQECTNLQNKICELNEKRKQMINHGEIDFKIKLFEYKLSCLSEFTLNKENLGSNLEQTPIGRVLIKDKK